jgi:mutator protein MutT
LSGEAARPFIHVVAGVVIDATDRVLIAQRPVGKHMAGAWEFPGGKLEPGEERLAGLARELQEEIGITLKPPARPLIRVRHTYPSQDVLLDVWVVRSYSGDPRGLDGQALRWCTQDELEAAELLPADAPIVAALRLPERLVLAATAQFEVRDAVLPRKREGDRLYGVYCTTAADGPLAERAGADFIVMRRPLEADEVVRLCSSVSAPVYVCAPTLEDAFKSGATGINLIRV